MAATARRLADVLCEALPDLDEDDAAAAAAAVLEHLNGQRTVKAVERELRDIRHVDPAVARSGVAASALSLARELDAPWTSASAKATCARALREALDRLRELAPPAKEDDQVDELSKRRQERRAAARTADAADPGRS